MSIEVRLSREMRLIDITMIGVGAMIGAGIFVLTGIAAGVAGPALLLAFLLNGFVALLTATAYAELGSAIHGAGGGYLWIKKSLPDPSGFLAGWMDWFAHAVACSLYALGFGAYFRLVLEVLNVPELSFGIMSLEKWLAVICCAIFSYINFSGASETGKAGNVVTVGKVAIIGGFIVAGLWVMVQRPGWKLSFEPFLLNGWGGVFAAMGLTFIAFEGYEIIAQTSEEVQNPKKNVPRAVFLSLLIVVPIYLLVAFVAIGAVTPAEGLNVTEYLAKEKEIALVSAADQFVVGGGLVILVGGLLSTLSALNATIYSSSRVAFAMARDASLPQWIGRVHRRRSTPHIAIFFSALIIISMAITLPIEDVAAAADIMFLLLFGGVNVALIRLRKLRPDLDRGFRVPFVPFTPILAIVTMLFLAIFLFFHYPMAWVAAGGWIAAGCVVYYKYSHRREAAFVEREKWMERIERKEYRVLVAVSSPRTVESLMEAALPLARERQGELVVVTVAEVPEGESLMLERPLTRELEEVLQQAVRIAEQRGVMARPVVKIGHRISHSLVQTAREEACNFLIIGQPKSQSFFERIVSTIVERVLEDAPCRVGVVYGSLRRDEVQGIALPVTRGMNSKLAASLAPAYADWFGVKTRPLTIVERETSDQEADKLTSEAQATLREVGLEAPLHVLRRREVGQGLSGAVKRGELILIGAPSSGPVAPLLGESIPSLMAKRGKTPVMVVRDVEERRARRFERVFFSSKDVGRK
jgi:amino acid transporter/nucleotide-binding universal stress UspA family protein